MRATLNKSFLRPRECGHVELLREVLEVIHLRHCCEPFDSRIHRADVYTDDCCALCKKLRAALAQRADATSLQTP